jgi:hypothetical protein
MTAVAEEVNVYFDLTSAGGDFFVLDDPVKGVLDNATYTLAGPVATDVTEYVMAYSLNRGRSRELDEIQAGTLSFRLNNYDGRFLPDAFNVPDRGRILDHDGEDVLDHNGAVLFDNEGVTGPYGADNIAPGKRVTVTAAGQAIFDGIIQSWQLAYDADLSVSVVVTAVDALAQLGRRSFNSWTATSGQVAGARLTEVLNRSEVAWSPNRAIGAGVATLQGDDVEYGANVLNYCQLVAKSDSGRLFASRSGVLVYSDFVTLSGSTPLFTFNDAGSGVVFASAELEYGDTLLYTDVSVERDGGAVQTVIDTASRDNYGIRRLVVGGLLFDSDTQSLALATRLSGIYSAPQARVNSLAVDLVALSPANQALVCSLDLNSAVTVSWTPRGGTAIVSDYFVEGLSHSADALGGHEVSVQLSPALL